MVCLFELLNCVTKLLNCARVALEVLFATDWDVLDSSLKFSQLMLLLSNDRLALLNLSIELLYVGV
jgi:hypothetical protein